MGGVAGVFIVEIFLKGKVNVAPRPSDDLPIKTFGRGRGWVQPGNRNPVGINIFVSNIRIVVVSMVVSGAEIEIEIFVAFTEYELNLVRSIVEVLQIVIEIPILIFEIQGGGPGRILCEF